MKEYYVNNDLIDKAYVLHYDEKHDTGYVEQKETCEVPDVQMFPIPDFFVKVAMERMYMLPAFIATWWSKRVTCEFNANEFIEFCNSVPVPTATDPEIGVVKCICGFNKDHGYSKLIFSPDVEELSTKLGTSKFDNKCIDIANDIWDAWHKDLKKAPDSEHVFFTNDATVHNVLNTAIYQAYSK